MSAAAFFPLARPAPLSEIAQIAGAEIRGGPDGAPAAGELAPPPLIIGVAPLDWSRPGDLCFYDNPALSQGALGMPSDRLLPARAPS